MKKSSVRGRRKPIVLVGGGGHAKVVIDALRNSGEFDIHGVLDPKLSPGNSILGAEVIGSDDFLPRIFAQGVRNAFITVGSIGNCEARKRVYDELRRIGFKLPVIAHPKAVIAKDAAIGEGTFVAASAVINPGVKIGRNVIVNTSSSIDHDCVIGDFVHVAPGAILSGGVNVGDETHIGTGAKVTQYLKIGRGCTIGAGTTVRSDMSDGQKNFGSHAAGAYENNRKVFIIAEAGVNHNGSLEIARRMVDAAKEAGADAVKFQTFRAGDLVVRDTPKAEYQKKATGCREGQLEMLKKLQLGREAHEELFSYCRQKKIIFLSAPFDIESVELLDRLGLGIFKIPSGEITNLPYLKKIGSLKKKIILSTGMSDLKEIEDALNILAEAGTPKKDITVLHCNTEYPTPYEDANLLAMLTIRKAFKVNVGYSDHTPGIEVPVAAAALGAAVIEKHFTLSREMTGPDHPASLEPGELKAMVRAIRNVERSLGDGVKRPSPSEIKNRPVVRKSIVAARDIKKDEVFTLENLAFKRPGTGISPLKLDRIIGKKAKKNFKADDLIKT